MELLEPFQITSRLLPGLHIGGAWVQLEYYGDSPDGRTVYQWTIDLEDGTEHQGHDLKSGCQGGNLLEGFGSLLCFLGAFAESYRYSGMAGENADLFPEALAPWAIRNSDEISMLQWEMEESESPRLVE